VPDEGKPFKTTLPGVLQVALVIVPTDGAVAGGGAVFITALPDDPDVHDPAETVKVYVPAVRPFTRDVAVFPVNGPPGVCVTVQVPDPVGKPVSSTLPVEEEQLGWVIVPMTGGAIVLTKMERGVALVEPQLVYPVTDKVPEEAPKVMVMAALPWPVIVAPEPE
jgi:hypothetical protein